MKTHAGLWYVCVCLFYVSLSLWGCSGGGDSAGGSPGQPAPGGGGDSAGGSPGQPAPGGGPAADSGACAVTLDTTIITTPTRLVAGAAACDYLLKGLIRIRSRLTIDPGTVIKAEQNAFIDVEGGEFVAVGQPNARIVLEGASHLQGYWQGINLSSASGAHRLEYVDIKDAGQECVLLFCPDAALRGSEGTLVLTNSTISNSFVHGAILGRGEFSGVTLVAFANNRFYGNRWAGLVVNADQVPLLDQASDYAGTDAPNGRPYVVLRPGSGVLHVATWVPLNAPYSISGFATVEAPLTLQAGVTLVFDTDGEEEGAYLSIESGGSLQAVGTATSPIVFTHANDTPYWGGINFDSASVNRLEYVAMSFGGDGALIHGFLHVDSGRVQVANSTFENSKRYALECGFDLPPGSLILGPGNTFRNNALGTFSPNCQR